MKPLCAHASCRSGFVIAFAILLSAANAAAQAPTRTVPVFANGLAQVVPGFQDTTQWIRQHLWVETEFDSDGDGKRDRVHVDVTRQLQTETEGLKVPVVYESSPYYAGTSGARQFLWDVKQEVGAPPPTRTSQTPIEYDGTRTRISNSQVNAWVPRGFAVVHSESPGTGRSQGCPTVGADNESLAPKAVIDWLNGRARGYTTIDGTEQVVATWATGKVGMTGTSYNGTLPLAAATTGVAGLEAIIPIAPNTSYYHYYRSNGLVRHPGGWLGEDIDFLYDFINSGDTARRAYCNRTVRDGEYVRGRDRQTGDYNDFWEGRDYLPKVKFVRAAVLMAHAFNDWNVVPEHSVRIVEALKRQGVPLQMYYHQGGHGGQPPIDQMNKWFTRYLFGIENGVEKDPKAWIVREGQPATNPTPYGDYPNPEMRAVTLRPQGGGNGIGTLTEGNGGRGPEKLVDDVAQTFGALAQATESKNRLLYATPELKEAVHISGTVNVTVRLASSKPAANLTAYLVAIPWDAPIAGRGGRGGGPSSSLITRGWADPQNYKSLTKGGNYDSKSRGEPLVPGRFYDLTFSLQPDDQIIPAGKRIALMIFSSDPDFTLWPQPGTELTVELAGTSISLPVVGGSAALRRAFGAQ
ncbi:MAG TPA: Xaa-Pro dipeptidyl-peptidase [Gemmatimonadaceae bacterium]|nr:Xaa-Pro dipeptidyl-peptidase [Gemmatimonadaceae bacterium]